MLFCSLPERYNGISYGDKGYGPEPVTAAGFLRHHRHRQHTLIYCFLPGNICSES